MITLLLVSWKLLPSPLLYLSAYIEANRQTYYDLLLTVSQRGDWNNWLLFFLQGVASQSLDAVARARRLQILRESYRRQLQQRRASGKLLQAIDHLFVHPVVTIQQIEAALEISFATAGKYVNQLETEGILREVTGQARNRIFLAEAILRAIDDPLPLEENE